MVEFKNENGTICSKTEKYYNSIKKYAKRLTYDKKMLK